MSRFRPLCLAVAALAALACVAGLTLGRAGLWQPSALAAAVALALGIGAIPSLRGYQFTAWIIAAVIGGMIYPSAFLHWGNFDLRNKALILVVVQLVMFGMGTQMSLHDFRGVARNPRGVLVGIVCHFSIMPLVGYGLTRLFSFPPEIAAGVILIGSCSSGLASNVMAYLARSNLVLSVTVTAITTLVAPVLTPFLMQRLAGTLVEVKFLNLMVEIIKIVLVPIGAAMLHDQLKHSARRQQMIVHGLSILAAGYVVFLLSSASPLRYAAGVETGSEVSSNVAVVIELSGFVAGAILAGNLYHQLTRLLPKLDSFMPALSMAGIVYFTTVTTAAGQDNLLRVGALLFVASVLHNGAGYFFGYWLSRVAGLDKNSARSVAFEVGLQNGGMASGLAGSMGKLGTVGLAPAIFSPWMNISGSILANYWRRRPVDGTESSPKP
ncbi:MAG TPA: bile acid:sodium symporter family protein [Opitutaceae bacterium]|nr:bile acid:sodium symporter family protein [Opitutaceae bacterium]